MLCFFLSYVLYIRVGSSESGRPAGSPALSEEGLSPWLPAAYRTRGSQEGPEIW